MEIESCLLDLLAASNLAFLCIQVLKHQVLIEELMQENDKLRQILVDELKVQPSRLQSSATSQNKFSCTECFECRRRQRKRWKGQTSYQFCYPVSPNKYKFVHQTIPAATGNWHGGSNFAWSLRTPWNSVNYFNAALPWIRAKSTMAHAHQVRPLRIEHSAIIVESPKKVQLVWRRSYYVYTVLVSYFGIWGWLLRNVLWFLEMNTFGYLVVKMKYWKSFPCFFLQLCLMLFRF